MLVFTSISLIRIIIYFVISRIVEDFDDWTNWLLYKGGVGIKGDKSWESWWDEEQVFSFTICLYA